MLVIDKVSHRFNDNAVLTDISLQCDSGKITCLIGPSGCGKTTLLRLVAGLLTLQSGQITLDGESLASASLRLPPEQRSVGMVFQEGALFPHMTVADNIAFGLPKKGAYDSALQWLGRVGLPDFANRYPESLSGGQRQRVALARALAPEPRVLLFDEPYANLDVPFRRALREDARQIIRQTDSIGLLVTHDPDEVLTVADHVVVLDNGGIVDVGAPQGLFDAPRSTYGAELFGEPQVFDATMHDQVITTAVGDWDRSALIDPTISSDALKLVVDADHLLIDPDPQGLLIDEIRAVGRLDRLYLKSSDGHAITFLDCLRVEGRTLSAGMRVRVTPKTGKVFASPASLG